MRISSQAACAFAPCILSFPRACACSEADPLSNDAFVRVAPPQHTNTWNYSPPWNQHSCKVPQITKVLHFKGGLKAQLMAYYNVWKTEKRKEYRFCRSKRGRRRRKNPEKGRRLARLA